MPTSASHSAGLFIGGQAPVSGVVPLIGFGSDSPSGITNLFLQGAPSAKQTRQMGLWIGGCPHSIAGGTTLFIGNTQSGVIEQTTLFVQGDGVTDGAVPYHKSMNLWLQLRPVAVTTLFIAGPGFPLSSGVSLAIDGAQQQTLSANLYTNAIGGAKNVTNAYINGW